MKRKPQRVPDFSSAKSKAKGVKGAAAAAADKPAVQPARTSAKPQATSSKSGHRGG
jgi:hypothetical protein